MSVDLSPTKWLAGYSSDGTNVTIPIASLPGLTAAAAAATTGDVRLVAAGIGRALANAFEALPPSGRPRTVGFTQSQGPFNAVLTTCLTSGQAPIGQNLAPEP